MRDYKKINPSKYPSDGSGIRGRTTKNRYTTAGRDEELIEVEGDPAEPTLSKFDVRPSGFLAIEPDEEIEVVLDLSDCEPLGPPKPIDKRTYYQRHSANLPRINPD